MTLEKLFPWLREIIDALTGVLMFGDFFLHRRDELWLHNKALDIECTHNAEYIGRPEFNRPNMTRVTVFENRFGSLVLHKFHRDDIDPPHDHSFDFVSLIVEGAYTEERWHPGPIAPYSVARRARGVLLLRGARTIHRVQPILDVRMAQRWPTSLVLRGPKRRPWNFWPQGGFDDKPLARVPVPWRTYLGIDDDHYDDTNLQPEGMVL